MARRPATRLPPPYLKRIWVDPERLADRSGYPFDLPLVRTLDLKFERPVTLVVGDNGSGKSTLLEAIALLAGFPTRGGNRNHGGGSTLDEQRLEWDLDEMDPSGQKSEQLQGMRVEGRLVDVLRAGWLPKVTDGFFFRAETFFDLARYLDESSLYGPGGPPPLHLRKSHAEGFLEFFEDRLQSVIGGRRPSLFVFDEPESALAPRRQLEFLRWVREIESSQRGQVIIATHSPVLMAYPGADLCRLRDGSVERVSLEEVDHFAVLREFFADPHGFVADGIE